VSIQKRDRGGAEQLLRFQIPELFLSTD